MEYYAPAKGAPSSFAGLEVASTNEADIASGGGPLYDDWQRGAKHGQPAAAAPSQRSPPVLDGGGGSTASEGRDFPMWGGEAGWGVILRRGPIWGPVAERIGIWGRKFSSPAVAIAHGRAQSGLIGARGGGSHQIWSEARRPHGISPLLDEQMPVVGSRTPMPVPAHPCSPPRRAAPRRAISSSSSTTRGSFWRSKCVLCGGLRLWVVFC
jgi:hypothetical protein